MATASKFASAKRAGSDMLLSMALRTPDVIRDQVVKLYSDGLYSTEIGKLTGIAGSTVCNILRQRGYALRAGAPPTWKNRKPTIDRIIELYRRGLSAAEVAQEVKVTAQHVCNILKRSREPIRGGGHFRKGRRHHNWTGGRCLNTQGYVCVLADESDPIAMGLKPQKGYVLEHRLVMSKLIGRSLLRDETVHHVNGYKTDNRPENLQLRRGKHGKGECFRCGDCGNINIVPMKIDDDGHG